MSTDIILLTGIRPFSSISADLLVLSFAYVFASAELHALVFAYGSASADMSILTSDPLLVCMNGVYYCNRT